MIGTLIAGGLTAAGAITGAIAGARENRRKEGILASEKARNEAWYNRKMSEDYTTRADAVGALTRAKEDMMAQNRQAMAQASMMGGTEESIANAKQATTGAYAGAVAQTGQAMQAARDGYEAQYNQTRNAYATQDIANADARAKNIATAASGLAQAGADIAGNWSADATTTKKGGAK